MYSVYKPLLRDRGIGVHSKALNIPSLGGGEREGSLGRAERILRALKLFYLILSWWHTSLLRLSKPTQYIYTTSELLRKVWSVSDNDVSA